MSKKGDAALEYARTGWAVIPLWPIRNGKCICGTQCGRNAGKHPLSDLVRHGLAEATTIALTITEWWRRYPDANVAIVTGSISGIFVMDIDPRHGGPAALAELQEKRGDPEDTLTASTGNGGTHMYFKYPGTQVKNSVSELGPGIDIRGDGGYVVAPPSDLGFGHSYTWVDYNTPIVSAIRWIEDAVSGPSAKLDPLDISTALNGVTEGQRDITLFRLACRFRAAGVPADLVEELLINAARKCTPPFPEDLAREKVTRAFRSYSKNYALTDAGNVERMVDRHGANLRYCEDGRWIAWNGTRWNGDSEAIAMNLAVEVTGSIITQALEAPALTDDQREERDFLIKHAYNSQNVFRLSAMVTIAKTDPALYVPTTEIDKDLFLLNMLNGTIDLRTGALRAHDRADLITKIGGCRYDPEVPIPKWLGFLDKFLPDPDVRAFIQRALGYSCTGSVAEQCLFFLYGSGRNGKSTLVKVMQRIMGQYARTGSPDLLLNTRSDSHPAVLADLMGSRFVPTIETEEGKRIAEATTKWLTGGDKLKARRLHHDYFEFDPTFKIFLVANHRPIIYGTDIAIWRRISMIPFNVQIPDEEKILDYDEIMFQEEGPGILAWIVQGAVDWYTKGLRPPAAVRAALDDYKDEMDIIGQFLLECVEAAPEGMIFTNDMYAAYVGWARLNGERPLTQRKFSNKIFELGYQRDRSTQNKYRWNHVVLTPMGTEYSGLGFMTQDTPTAINLMRGA